LAFLKTENSELKTASSLRLSNLPLLLYNPPAQKAGLLVPLWCLPEHASRVPLHGNLGKLSAL
jgi:hypothetical protein